MKLKTGVDSTSRITPTTPAASAFHGMGAFVGIGQDPAGSRLYGGIDPGRVPEAYKKIDPEKLAGELEVDMCAVNSGRFWMMDELEFAGGETRTSTVSSCAGAAT